MFAGVFKQKASIVEILGILIVQVKMYTFSNQNL